MLLTSAEIEDLTGRIQPAAQIRWLVAHGWRFAVNSLGRPRIAVAEFNRRMVGGRTVKQEPNFGALNGTH